MTVILNQNDRNLNQNDRFFPQKNRYFQNDRCIAKMTVKFITEITVSSPPK